MVAYNGSLHKSNRYSLLYRCKDETTANRERERDDEGISKDGLHNNRSVYHPTPSDKWPPLVPRHLAWPPLQAVDYYTDIRSGLL